MSENIGNVIGGHKANLSNPNTSEASKEHSKDVIDELADAKDNGAASVLTEGKDPTRVAAGFKAATHNPTLTEETKEKAAEKLEQLEK